MRFLSFKTLFVLVLLPPVMYVAAIQGIERYLEHYYRIAIEKRIPGDTQSLLAGRIRLADNLETAVGYLLSDRVFRQYGVVLSVTIRTQRGRRLYPPVYGENRTAEQDADPMRIASENFALLKEGLDVSLEVTIDHNTRIANGLLALSILLSLAGLVVVYRRGVRVYAREEALRQREQEKAKARENQQNLALTALKDQKNSLSAEIETVQVELNAAKARAERNEADLFDEVETLENRLQQNISKQDHQQSRIQELEAQLSRLETERKALGEQQGRAGGGLRKRMKTLYKKTSFSDRSLSGLMELPESMRIKAEEVIQQLDARAGDVPIKRKLFRGKGKETVFEIVFAYKGRLYFRRTKDRKVEILAIGTKNSQDKDLVYLERL